MKNKKTDPQDYDGMGDFSRYRNANSNLVSLENTVKNWFKEVLGNTKRDDKKQK